MPTAQTKPSTVPFWTPRGSSRRSAAPFQPAGSVAAISYYDTAPLYGHGLSEARVGAALLLDVDGVQATPCTPAAAS